MEHGAYAEAIWDISTEMPERELVEVFFCTYLKSEWGDVN